MMKRMLALCLSLLMLCTCALAETTDEEMALWGELSGADATEETADSDATAENAAELTPEEIAYLDQLAATLDSDVAAADVDLADLGINEKLPDHVVNILLLGVDNRSTQLQSGRSDATIICSINLQTGSVKLTSIGRDTAVVVPGYKEHKRMNTAFKYGSKDGDIAKGAELAMKTVNTNFGMNISRYVVVNIHGLADIIQALGGVDMELTKAEASAINYELFVKEPMGSNAGREKLELRDGVQHLDGMQAVTYGRIRNLKGQNDLNRNSRQRHLLEVLLGTVMVDMDFGKLTNLITTALPYGFTNLTVQEMATLGLAVITGVQNLPEGEPLVGHLGLPLDKQYGYRQFGGNALLYINEKRMVVTQTTLQEFIYGQSYLD